MSIAQPPHGIHLPVCLLLGRRRHIETVVGSGICRRNKKIKRSLPCPLVKRIRQCRIKSGGFEAFIKMKHSFALYPGLFAAFFNQGFSTIYFYLGGIGIHAIKSGLACLEDSIGQAQTGASAFYGFHDLNKNKALLQCQLRIRNNVLLHPQHAIFA